MRAIHRPGRTAAHNSDTARTRCTSTSAGRWAPPRSAGTSSAARARRSGARPRSHDPDDLPHTATDSLQHAGRLPHFLVVLLSPEQREVDEVAHRLVAGIVRVQVIPTVVLREEEGRVRRVSREYVEFDDAVERSGRSNPGVHRLAVVLAR